GAGHGLLAIGRLDGTGVARIARPADLLGPGVLEAEVVAREGRPGELPVVVVEGRRIRLEAGAQAVRIRWRRRPARRRVLVEADDADVDVLRAVAAPEPGLAALDRPADVEAVVLDVLDRRARAGA